MARRRWVLLGLIAVAAGVLYVATTKGFPSTHAAVSGFFRETLGLSAARAESATHVVRKCFHVPAYGLLAFLAWWALPPLRHKAIVVLGLVFAVAVGDELLQSLQPARNGSPLDVVIDLVGATIGIWLARRWKG